MTVRVWLPRFGDLRADSLLAFERLDGRRRILQRGDAVLAALPTTEDCELVLHPFDAVLLDVRLPKLGGARLAAALPGIVEERVSGDIDQVHVVSTPRAADGSATAVIVDRLLLRRTLDLFARAGHRVGAVTPQPLAVAHVPGAWMLRAHGDAAALRWGTCQGAALALVPSPATELALLLRHAGKPTEVVVSGDVDTAGWADRLDVAVRRAGAETTAAPIAVDLLQYEFAPSIAVGKSWRPTLALAALLVATAVIGLNVHAFMMRSDERALRDDMARQVRETFPEVPVVLDPVAQMRRLVAGLGPGSGPDGLVALMSGLAQVLPPDSVQRLEYREGILTVLLRPDSGMTDPQRQSLAGRAAEAGLDLEISANGLRLSRKALP
ncbi:MAG: type II secretion system protein GspL [Burkholderiales bacterium]